MQPLLDRRHRELDATLVLGDPAAHNRQIALGDATVLERALERSLGLARPSAEQKTARLSVEPVCDPRSVDTETLSQEKRERVLVIGGRGMHRQSRRFVEREHRVVFVDDVEKQRHVRFFERGTNQENRLPGANPLARSSPGTVLSIRATAHDLLGSGAREARDPRLHEPIEALARMLGSDGKGQQNGACVTTRGKPGLGPTATQP